MERENEYGPQCHEAGDCAGARGPLVVQLVGERQPRLCFPLSGMRAAPTTSVNGIAASARYLVSRARIGPPRATRPAASSPTEKAR